MSARFTLSRGKFNSPLIYDHDERRPVAVFLRDWQGEDMIPEAADAAAMRKAEICTQALNREHERIQVQRQGARP